MRFTFIYQAFEHYDVVKEDKEFVQRLEELPDHFIWNLYKQLSFDILDRAAELSFEDIQAQFPAIIEQLKDQVKTLQGNDKNAQLNLLTGKDVMFKLVWSEEDLEYNQG